MQSLIPRCSKQIALLAFAALAANAGAVEVRQEWIVQHDTASGNEGFDLVQIDPAGTLRLGATEGYLKYWSDGTLAFFVPQVGLHCSLLDAASNCYGTRLYGMSAETVKLDPDGAVLWARSDVAPAVPSPEIHYHQFASDPAGNVLVLSQVRWVENFSYHSGVQLFKYAPDGTPLWSAFEQYSIQESYPAGIAVDSAGNVFVAALSLDPSGFTVSKYAANGTRLWQDFFAGNFNGNGKQVRVDAQGDAFFIDFSGIRKLDASGQQVAFAAVDLMQAPGLAVDASSNIVAFGTGTSGAGWVRKFDNALVPLWEYSLGSGRASDMSLDGLGQLFLTGADNVSPPVMMSWVLDGQGQLLATLRNTDVSYAGGASVAVQGQAFYVAGSTYSSSTSYGSVLVKYAVVDTTPPTTAITAPAANTKLPRGPVTVSATASDNVGVTRVEFYYGATLIGTSTAAPYSITWDTTPYSRTSGNLRSRALDAAGNEGWSPDVPVSVK